MKFRPTTVKVIAIGGIGIIFLWYWMLAPCPSFHLAPHREFPDLFPGTVWPQGEIGLGCYYLTRLIPPDNGRGIGTAVSGLQMINIEYPIHEGYDLELLLEEEREHPLEERVYLFVDGEQISNSSRNVSAIGDAQMGIGVSSGLKESYEISWSPLLFYGNHTARVVIETLSGKIIEYGWQFTIVFP